MDILRHPLATEKAIRAIEADNTVTFIVDRRASKRTIKREFESKFRAKIDTIKTVIATDGTKKAFIRLKKDSPAIDIATQLGMM
jgi:large subunit ribosomal protein L23